MIFYTPIFCQWLFVYARVWICCKTLAKLKFSVNAWDREANFLYQNLSSRSNNDVFAHSHSRNASKQLFRFRFMPSQFETHGNAASRTQCRRNRAPCPPYTDSPNTRPEPSERQQKTAPSRGRSPSRTRSRRGSPKPSPDWKSRNRAEDPNDRPRRADPRRNADRMQKPAGAIAPGATTRRAAPCIVASPNKYPQPEQTPHRTPYTEPERIAPTCHT